MVHYYFSWALGKFDPLKPPSYWFGHQSPYKTQKPVCVDIKLLQNLLKKCSNYSQVTANVAFCVSHKYYLQYWIMFLTTTHIKWYILSDPLWWFMTYMSQPLMIKYFLFHGYHLFKALYSVYIQMNHFLWHLSLRLIQNLYILLFCYLRSNLSLFIVTSHADPAE